MHKLSRRRFLGYTAAGSGLATFAGYDYISRVETQRLTVERIEVPLEHLGSSLEGFKIVQMSDFHLQPYTQLDLIQEAVTIANELKPDLVVLTGDYVTASSEEDASSDEDAIFKLAPVLATLNAKYGVFAVLGNHDYWAGERRIRTGLIQSGLTVLKNTSLSLGVGNDTVHLVGLDDGWAGRPDLSAALVNFSGGSPVVLLIHEPDFADRYCTDERVSLQLSGHSHGGQVRLPGLGAPVLPRWGSKYDQGLYRIQNMWVYTTRGIGVLSPPVRFNCPPEVTEVTLIPRTGSTEGGRRFPSGPVNGDCPRPTGKSLT